MNETQEIPQPGRREFRGWWVEDAGITVDRGGHAKIARLYAQAEGGTPVAVLKECRHDRVRFDREIEITKMLYSGNLFIQGSLTGDANPWIVLRYLAGGSLRQRLEERRFVLPIAQLLAKIAAEVDHYIAKGVLHRDLKPANIVFATHDDQELRIIDFGVAVYADQVGRQTSKESRAYLGTGKYMAPERKNGGDASVKTEICEFAIVAAELAHALDDSELATELQRLAPNAQHPFQKASDLLQAALDARESDPNATLRRHFLRRARELLHSPLAHWHHNGDVNHASDCMGECRQRLAMTNCGEHLIYLLSDWCQRLVLDCADHRVTLTKEQKSRARADFFALMDYAIALAIEPQQRARIEEFNKTLRRPGVAPALLVPARNRGPAKLAVDGVKRYATENLGPENLATPEAGVGQEAQFAFLTAATQLFPFNDPLNPLLIRTPEDYSRVRGRLNALKLKSEAVTFIFGEEAAAPDLQQKIDWLIEFGVVVIQIDAGVVSMWLMREDDLIPIVRDFIVNLNEVCRAT